MSFQDRSAQSVQSLLALLRETQEGTDDDIPPTTTSGPTRAATGGPSTGATFGRRPSSSAATSQPQPRVSSGTGGAGAQGGGGPVPSSSMLSSLLAQLSDHPGVPTPPTTSTAAAQNQPRPSRPGASSAFDGRRGHVDLFGPVGQTPGPSKAWEPAGVRRVSGDGMVTSGAASVRDQRPGPTSALGNAEAEAMVAVSATAVDKGKRKADELDDNKATWSFTRCLPVITDLLRDDDFVRELRKMKSDQDALERRLWARMEKIKADHGRKTAPEREIAKITRKTVPADKQAQWARELKKELDTFFRTHVLPTQDGLIARQRARLVELDVPGLGDDNDASALDREARTREKGRVKRIMDVLDGAIADA
ncbi:uncharacterized protein EHS24_000104 [Apiotrichum porosum]|uniref:Uncharacterized protein n=1 Tax=Apiotrichum porosum TaxID=105984 RepID=A0A427Y8Z6_9TREE|nr:uncharacterized protein EHS24_000104 [Apiotrichum porosum]RSH87592.1 hypothetical protein EHS24_000104 [Apiotrichum porosum]